MSELINKLNQYRSMGDKFYPEDIVVIEDIWALVDEIERLKEKLKFEEATNKELLSTGAELEKKLYEEQDKNKRLKKELQEEIEEKEHYQAIVESWE